MTGREPPIAFLRQLPPPNSMEQRQPRYPLSPVERLVIGRDPNCEVVLDSLIYRAVSRRHADFGLVQGFDAPNGIRAWQVCDLESANGTFINGQRLQGCRILQAGDRIMLGQNGPEFVFECEPDLAPSLQSEADPNVRLPRVPSRRPLRRKAPPTVATPRQEVDRVSLTQLFPIFSTGQQLTHKAYLLPAIITVAVVISLFLTVGTSWLFNLLLAVYLSGAAYYFIYELCGKHKPWWVLLTSALITVGILVSPVLNGFVYVFRELLPGRLPAPNSTVSFPLLFVKMFFGAGLMEELLKAVPVLFFLFVGNALRSPLRERIGVREPLDGILLGSASAVGFTLVETLGQYVPEIYKVTLAAGGQQAAELASLQLLIPRVLGSVAGHMAYSGYLGYFIGLSVLRPRYRWRILAVGYLSASALHALWNVTGTLSPALLAVVGVLSYAFLGAAILKARELSPNRSENFATRFYK